MTDSIGHPAANANAPPIANASTVTVSTSSAFGELLPLWIWLAIAVLTSFFCTPADPVSMLMVLALGLFSFCVGTFLGSQSHLLVRISPLLLWIGAAFSWALLLDLSSVELSYFDLIVAGYAPASIGFGVWACRRIRIGKLRILVSFSAGYFIGSLFGILGTPVGAVLGAYPCETLVASAERFARQPENVRRLIFLKNPNG